MEGAKYFIEVYDSNDLHLTNTEIDEIRNLDLYLNESKNYGFKTIAVWYIKPKIKTP